MNCIRPALVLAFVVVPWLAAWPAAAAPPAHTEPNPAPMAASAPININTADIKELMKLEGVGRRVAEKIVEYRDSHGPFKKPEELRKVEGIGSGLWEKNRTRIVIK